MILTVAQSLAEAWLFVAGELWEARRRVLNNPRRHESGVWICNVADHLKRTGNISHVHEMLIMRAIEKERRFQGVSKVNMFRFGLWGGTGRALSAGGCVERIKFCTAQIRAAKAAGL